MNKDLLIDDILKEKANSEVLSVPKDLDLKIKQTISSLPDRKKPKSKFSKRLAAAVILTAVTSTTLSAAFPAYARNMPVVGSVFQFLSERNIIDKDYIEYSTDLNLSKVSNDVKVTINSITYDGIDLSIVYTVESKEEIKSEASIAGMEFKINGRAKALEAHGIGKLIDKNTFAGLYSLRLSREYLSNSITRNVPGSDEEIPENFIMDLNIKRLSNAVWGQWDFKFKVSSEKIQGKVSKVKTSVDLSKLRLNLKVNEVIFTPIKTVLRTVSDNIQTYSDSQVDYIAFDDKGRYLPLKDSIGDGDPTKIYGQYTFSNVYDDAKSVTFIPCIRNIKNTEIDSRGVKLNLDGSTILSEGEFGEYKINKVEFLKDKTLIYYECTKYLAAMNPYGLVIGDGSSKAYELSKDKVRELGNNKFVAEIEVLPNNKQYWVTANNQLGQYDLREDLKFTVEVK
jgi:hypothetical protein